MSCMSVKEVVHVSSCFLLFLVSSDESENIHNHERQQHACRDTLSMFNLLDWSVAGKFWYLWMKTGEEWLMWINSGDVNTRRVCGVGVRLGKVAGWRRWR